MANKLFIEQSHPITGLAPVADAFAGTVYSDIVSMKNHGKVVFIVFTGLGATGTSTFTVQACDDTSASNTSAVAFHYKSCDNTDVPGAITAATTSGFANTGGSNRIHLIEVDAEALLASGYSYIRLKAVEATDAEVLGGILVLLLEPRSTEDTGNTQI